MRPTNIAPLVDAAGAAKLLGWKPAMVRRLAKANLLPHYNTGTRLLFHPAELARWEGGGRPSQQEREQTVDLLGLLRDGRMRLVVTVEERS